MSLALPILLIAVVALLFFQSTRQKKSLKQIAEMQGSLLPGDRVLTTAGLHATVVATSEETIVLQIAPGVDTEWDRRVIREKIDPGAPGSAQDATDNPDTGAPSSGV